MSSIIIGSNAEAAAVNNQRAYGDTIAMQLASITYCSLNGNTSVKDTLKAYLPDWELVWQPVNEIDGNYAFIAFNGVQYVIAIRGSILNFSWGSFDNWIKEDFNILNQTPWLYTNDPASNPMISQGSADGLAALNGLYDENGDGIYSFLQKTAFINSNFLCVTGHSLGGNLCTVYALWLQYQMQQANVPKPGIFSVLSFAAPSSWNQAFVDQFTKAFTNSWRYYGLLDIVPFSACEIADLGTLYNPPSPSANDIYVTVDGINITLTDAFIAIDALIIAREVHYNSVYEHVNQTRGAVQLNTTQQQYPINPSDPLIEQWFAQAGAQHDHNHYLDWLGGVEVNCVG